MTTAQAEALVRLFARVTNAGLLASISIRDTFLLLDLVEEGLKPETTLESLREEYHTLALEDRLTVRRTLQEMAGEDDHEG